MHPNFKIIRLPKQQSFGRYFQRKAELGAQRSPSLPAHVACPTGWCWQIHFCWPQGHDETRCDSDTRQNRVWLQTGNFLTRIQREWPVPWQSHLGNGGKAAFLLHKYFSSVKYCDNWSALVVTPVQEPGLASIMNTMWLPPPSSSQVKSPPFQQEQKQSNENRKMGSWYIKLFSWKLK